MFLWSLLARFGRAHSRLILAVVALGLAVPAAASTDVTSNSYRRYTLDLSEVTFTRAGSERTGMLGVGHNQAVAFPLDLSATHKKVRRLGPSTIIVAQTKSQCAIDGIRMWPAYHHSFVVNIDAFGPVQPKDTAAIRSLTLELPSPSLRAAGTFCLGFHTRSYGWIVILTPIQPVLNEAQRMNVGHVEIDVPDADVVGILFDNGAGIKSISFEAQKWRIPGGP